MNIAGWLLVVFGVTYIVKPDLFRRGVWRKTSVAQRTLSPGGYLRYMRGVGVFCVLVGLYLVFGSHRVV
jgi:hypothetical protein